MALFECGGGASDDGLKKYCKDKVLSSSYSVPTIVSGRITISQGGYVRIDGIVYLYIKGSWKYANLYPDPSAAVSDVGLLSEMPTIYNISGVLKTHCVTLQNNSHQGFYPLASGSANNGFAITFDKQRYLLIDDEIEIYGFYYNS